MDGNEVLKQVRDLINNKEYKANQNFFESGGTSIQIIELASIVYEVTGKELDMTEFFSNPYIDQIKFTKGEDDGGSGKKVLKKPTALFIHDGSGLSDCYRHFYKLLGDNFEIVRIDFPTDRITLAPQLIDIKKLALEYINKLDQDSNFEYVFGWCIGGKIAYEMSKNIKSVTNVIIMNSPAPTTKEPDDITFKSEKQFIKKTFKIPFLRVKNETINSLWEKMVDHYTTHNNSFEMVKKFTPVYIKFLIPNFYSDKLVPSYYFKHLNLIRSFSIAHDLYKTKGKIAKPKFYFFNAQDENFDKDHKWENYVDHGSSYEFPGTHTDIVNQENSEKIIDIITG